MPGKSRIGGNHDRRNAPREALGSDSQHTRRIFLLISDAGGMPDPVAGFDSQTARGIGVQTVVVGKTIDIEDRAQQFRPDGRRRQHIDAGFFVPRHDTFEIDFGRLNVLGSQHARPTHAPDLFGVGGVESQGRNVDNLKLVAPRHGHFMHGGQTLPRRAAIEGAKQAPAVGSFEAAVQVAEPECPAGRAG